MALHKVYEANKYETDIYNLWEESGAFQPSEHGEPFSIIMPPPNATGRLHVGHAAMLAIEDTLARYARMNGKSVLWIPGTDHAAIATNAIMEKQLSEEGQSKHDIGREEFLNRLSQFVEDSRDNIRSQVRAMGSSCDWTKERYTMEPAMNRIVSEVFIKMYNDGLIYRGKRIVNWDHVLQTTISDDEIEYKDVTDTFYTFKYGPFEIGTARPETKFGDKYVVMHPDDKRYRKYKHGDTFEAEWINGPITATVIKDEAVDPEFGTGVMTITPWHDVADFEIAQRHNLDMDPIIDLEGRLLDIAEEFKGLHIDDARELIARKLDAKGLLLEKDENYTHRIAISDRGKAVVEPQVMEQWFVDVNKPAVHWKHKKMTLKEVMQDVVNDKDIDILPERFTKTYFHWIDNLRDWCISRQIWWGHQIPAWYREKDGKAELHVGHVPPEKDSEGWMQDPDTLDTWFSSALWTWSTMIPPEVALDKKYDLSRMIMHSHMLKKYHPTTVMETGYDILFFWVARMILMTTYTTGEIPFKTVYLHGLVRTKDGSKMSKSNPESIIDPLDMIEKYGTDALRLSLIVGQAPGNDMRIYEEKIASYRNFCNKLWNIARYVESNLPEDFTKSAVKPISSADHWILERLDKAAETATKQLESYDLGQAFDTLYHFIWDDFADWYIESSKIEQNVDILAYVLEMTLKLSHPFAPFVTETIWDTLSWEDSLLITAEWPKIKSGNSRAAKDFKEIQAIVKEVRTLQGVMGTSRNTLYYTDADFLEANKELVKGLANLAGVKKVSSGKGFHLTKTHHDAWIDIETQKAREYIAKLTSDKDHAAGTIQNLKNRLDNESYVRSAPKEIVQQTRDQLAEAEAILVRLEKEISAFEHALDQI